MPDLVTLLEECGLAAHAGLILPLERPCVWLSLKGPWQGEVGASRVGGLPDLLEDVAWPLTSDQEPMDFALQINLADLPKGPHWPLPATGLLSIFVGLDEPATDVEHRIFLLPPQELRPRALPEGEIANEMFREIAAHQLELTYAPDFPRWASNDFSKLEAQMGEDDALDYNDSFVGGLCPIDAKRAVGKLFGHVAGIGHDPREDAYVVKSCDPKWLYDYKKRASLDMSQADSWQPLVTIESCMDLDLCIWDAGYLQILIERERLLKADFSNCYAAVESS